MKTPLVTLALVAANVLAFQAEIAAGGLSVCERFGLVPARFTTPADLTGVVGGMFLHDPRTLVHLGGNMACLILFGTIVERSLGGLRFLALYLTAGIVGGLLHVLCDPTSTTPLVGASGAVFGVLAMAAMIRPSLLGFAVALGGAEIWRAFTGGSDGVSFGCHLGGLAAGALFAATLRATNSEALETA